MTLKELILWAIERRVLGAPARLVGAATRDRPRLFGLANPFHVPAFVVERDGARYAAMAQSYLALRGGRGAKVRLDADAYEPEIAYLGRALVREGDIVLDIGANVGLHTVAFARLARRGHVYAFEPVAEMAEQISRNAALNRLDNVTVVGCALGAADETRTMKVNVAGAGMEGTSSLTETVHLQRHPERYAAREVPVRRLDDVMATLKPAGRVALVKIDTEGFEPQVIEGGLETLRRHRPAMIVEAHSRRLAAAGKSFRWYLETFPDHHVLIVYGVNRANPYLRLEPLVAEPPEIAVNLLLLPRLAAWTAPS